MSKYRFKTEKEFIRDGLWDEKYNCPNEWAWQGSMNKYLGIDVPDECIVYCDKNEKFNYDGWLFQNTDYVLKEQQEYFDDLSQHIGRYIRALVDNPHSGSRVYKGDIGKIINKGQVDFQNRKGYNCTCALDKNNLGTKYELLPEDYSPEQENKEPNVEFIPGKWYKLINCKNAYRKCSKIPVEDRLPYSELIENGGYRCETGSIGDLTRIKLIEDLSEIQEYLPEGHPDKVKNFKFEIGKWYSFNWDRFGKNSIVIAKIKEVREKDFIISWRSYLWKDNDYNDEDGYMFKDISNIKELSIDEVQQYLPDGHSDKIIEQKFEIGKWYKWYQKNHGNYHYGKVKTTLETDTFVMSPWIIQCDDYNHSGTFDLSKAEQIQEISVEDIQEFLPNNHPDKITSDVFKKGEYIVLISDGQSTGGTTLVQSNQFIKNHCYKVRENNIFLRPELDSDGSITNGWQCILYNPNRFHETRNWRYATEKESIEYERRGKPYDVTELQKKQLSMEEIQEECKKRFPIGCTFTNTKGKTNVLKDDSSTYAIVGQNIWAHYLAGSLYEAGKWATLVSLPEENITEIPEYVECINYFGDKYTGKIYNTKLDKPEKISTNTWYEILIDCGRLKDGSFKISNKEAYEQQKSLSYESVSGCFPTDKTIFNYDEVSQYLSTAFDYWKNVPKFVEKEFDIYGPTPDIE